MSNHSIYSGMTLKDLLKNPDLQRAPGALSGAPSQKVKKASDDASDVDFTAAFLGPQLWNKTYNSNNFNLDYMDLDEFLGENLDSVPVVETVSWNDLITSSPPHHHNNSAQKIPASPRASPSYSSLSPHTSPRISPNPHVSPNPYAAAAASPSLRVSPNPRLSPNVGFGLHVSPPHSPPRSAAAATALSSPSSISVHSHSTVVSPPVSTASCGGMVPVKSDVQNTGATSSGSTPPASPVPVQVDFQLSEQDLALSSIPGHCTFDPTSHTFSEEELKPQPMIKKSRKIFVPEDLKDDRYWARREKNNYAAKRSRDARRVKENQIAMRASYLEKENRTFLEEIEKMRCENVLLKRRLSKYEPSA
ncbi:hypothetical protein ACOMHN_033298 [Nucella lapillus]